MWYANTFRSRRRRLAHLYSFSFKRHYDWSRTHPMRDEILRYTNEIIDEWGLRPHFRLRTTVSRVRWCGDATSIHSTSVTPGGRVRRGRQRRQGLPPLRGTPIGPVSANSVGRSSTRATGIEHDLGNDTVAIVGTGATAVRRFQVAAVAKKVYVFQREPGWVIPRNDREWTAEESARGRPYVQRLKRIQMYVRFERLIFGMRRIRDRKTSVQITAETYIDERFRDRDDLRAAVTPTYPFGGKRPLFDGRFYEALTRDNVGSSPGQ